MAEKEYSIHSMAKKLDVSVSTLSSYLDRFKAFIPFGEKNGLKSYGPDAFEIIKTIVEWRRDKITLSEIEKNFKVIYPIVNPANNKKEKDREKEKEKEEKPQLLASKKEDNKAEVDLKVIITEKEAKIRDLKGQIELIEKELDDYKKLYELMKKYDLTLLK